LFVSGPRALQVGILDPENESAARRPREQPIEQSRPDIAHMEISGRARRESDANLVHNKTMMNSERRMMN
jgi:hypothetical protein